MPYDKIDQLYDALKKDGAVSKSRENFRSKMLAPGKEGYQNRLQLYKALKADGAIDSPTYEEFGKRLGLHAVNNTPAPAHPHPQKPTAAPAQAATPAPNSAPATPQQKDKPLTPAQRQAMIDQVQQMQQQTQAMIADNNERMKNMKQYGFGLGFGQTKKGGVKYNPRTKKFEQTYITPTGNRYSSKALADAESFRYRKAASEPLGLNMNDQQVNDAQKPASAAVAALWKEAEAKYAADRNKNAEDVYSGNPWLHGGREMHIVDAATNSHKNEVSRLTRFDLQKMMDNAWGRVGKQMTASCYAQLKKQYPTATERQLQNSASAMARQLSDNAVYKYAVAKNTPKSTLEFFAKTAADMNLLRTINKGLARSEAGTTGDMAAYEQAMSDYGKNHRWAQIGGTVTGMMFDPTTYISGGVGSFAGKTALNIGGRIVAKKAATNVGARLFSNTLTGRVVAGVAGGAGNLGAYEGIKEGESQWLHGGHINQETGENEGYSAGDVLKSSLHGTLLGSVTGTVSPLLGNVADKWVKATSNTAGKVGIRAGELATSTVAEGTIFSIPEWISGDGDAMDVWTDNMAMMIGFKGQHMIKSAPRVIAGLRPIADPKTMQERNHNRMSFLERLRTQLDASPRDMAFTKEEREELQKYGYGDLAALFTRTPKQQPKAKAKQPTDTDGKVMNFDIPEAEVEDLGKQWLKTHPEFDGYEAMQRLIQDPSVSQSARAKAYYILTGHQLPMGTVTGYTTEKDEHGNIFVKSVTANGEVVTNRRFADEASAKREQEKIMRQAELNSVDVGERYTEAKADNKVWNAAVEAVAPGADPETVKRNYQAAKEGDKDAIANYGQIVDAIDKFMEENRGMADAERPEAIRAAIKEETGVDVDTAIKKESSKRTEPEQAAVEDYLKRLFPEQNQEAEQPMSDDEAGAAAIYDQSRLLWDKVEQGDADAKADVDAIVLRMQEALQECEDAFGTDAEMRMAEMQDNPWALANDPELTEDQQNAVLYYINAKAAMDGVQDASNDAMENKRREVAANVERHTHKDNGMVQPATMKVDDKPVYIVKGNVAVLPDGTGIDTQNSDQSIVICDAETGEYKFTSPDQIFNLGDAIDPQAELDEAYANIQAEHEAVLGGMGNGESVPNSGESVQETPENVQNEGENVQPPMTDEQLQQYAQGAFNEATQGDGGVTLPQEQVEQMQQHNQQMLEQDQQRREEEANRKPTALERVPLNEETGEPMFEKADKETALDALNEVTGGNDANTTAIVNAQVEQAQKTLDALKKKQPTKKAPSLKGSPMAMVKAQQEADANYNTAMEQYNAQVAEAEETLGAWSRIYALMNERKRAIREQQEAERRERDARLHDEAVAQVEEQKRIAAQKAAEQAEVGTHAVNPKIKAKWDGAAVDARLVEMDAEDDPKSKTNEAVRQTLRSLKETDDYKGTVAIFADHYQNKRSGFNLYEDIKQKLIAQGVPESEVVVMKPGMTIKKKLEIFDKVNRGEVRVVLGSTATLGTGVNIQERLHTLIHLDAPNRPMDYTQRNGRILRQGNLHKQWGKPVRVLRFGVEDSLDVTAYQRLKTKGAIADSVMEGDRLMQDSMNNRVLEEEEDVFGDTVAQLSGSEYALLKNNAEKNVRKYESRRKQWEADQTYIHNAKPKLEGQIKAAEQRAEEANAHLLAVQKAFPDGKFTEITVGKQKFGSVDAMSDFIKEHNKKILDAVKAMKEHPGNAAQTNTLTLSLGGYDFVVKTEMSRETQNIGGSLFAEIHRKMTYSCPELGLTDIPVKQSLLRNAVEDITENVITGKDFAERFDIATRMVKHGKSELEQLKQRESKPFEFGKELEEAKRQFEEYSEAMKVEMAEKEKKYAEMDASVEAATDVVADDEDETSEDKTKFRLLEDDDPKAIELESLPDSELVPVYRNVQAFEDDALGSPMAFTDAETGERRTLQGQKWNYSNPPQIELTPEQQRQLDELNKIGYIVVDGKKTTELQINDGLKFVKPKTKDAQLQYFLKKNPEDKGLWAAYDPYDHAIETPLNTQFGEAYKRPNLVVVRSLIPKSEIDEPFHADYALLPTGAHQWNNGRTLYLSRWSKIDKVLTREEEAKLIDEYWKKHPGKREALKSHRDYNRFVPQVRRELEKMGYRFELDGKELTPEESLALDRQNMENRDVIPGREGHAPFMTNEDIARINAKMSGKWVSEPKEAMNNAMAVRVNELAERLHTPVRIIRTDEEVAALPSARQRRMKGSFNPMTGEVTIVVPNNANMADVENTFIHEVVGHDGLRVLFPEEEKLNNALDELYRVSKDEIRNSIDRMAQKMYDAEVDRLREKKRKEHEANGEDSNASYYADMAEAHAEASKKREQFKRDATEEYGADLAGRIGEKGFEKMSAKELTFWGKLKSMLQKALQKLLDGLKIPGKKKWGDKEWAFVLHEAYKRKKNGGKPDVFDAADTEVMRRKTGFGETKFSDGHKKSAQLNEAALKHLEPTDVEHAAKVQQKREKAKEALANVAKTYKNTTDSKGFISDLSNSLGLTRGSTGSGYGSFETPNGKVFTIRVSNHNINAANVGDEPVESIVIKTKRSPNRFHAEDGKFANEYVYFKEDIRKAPAGTLSAIAESISDLLDTGEYHDKTGLAKDNHSPETDPDGGMKFRDGDMGLDETITQMKIAASQANADNWQAKQEAMKAIGGNLNKLRQAMARQREYDLSTVKSITDLAKVLLDNGLLDDLSKYETKRILSAVNNAHGKQDTSNQVAKVMDIMVDNQLRMGANMLGRLLSTRGSRVDARGIEVQGQLDPDGQTIAQVVRKATSLPKSDIEERIAEALNRMGSDDQAVADEAALEYSGLLLAHQFAEDITDSKAEEKALRDSIKQAKEDLDAGMMEKDAYHEYVEATNDSIRQNKIERAEAYRSIVEQVGSVLGGSVERAKQWREAEKQRVEAIHHNANSDMVGRPTDEHHKEGKVQKIANNSAVRFLLAPLGTFDQMLRMFGKKSVNGEGYLWNRYMRGWVDATEREYKGYQNALKTLDEKVSEVFSKNMKWGDLFAMERKMPKTTVTFWDGGEWKYHELTQGNLLYIYMVDKMADGRMKLRRMGITEEDVENIKDFVDPRFLQLADWMQEEFLVGKRNEYNEVHKRMFGASMAAIENYFPLKILTNARIEDVDVADDTTDTALPATSTGSIIKRRRNNLALDVMGADAFSVILDHVQQMERWAAFAEFNRDLNTLLSYKHFRNQVMNMSSVYGGGKTLWNNFRNVCSMAAGAYRPPIAQLDKAAVNIAKGVTAAKVSFRVFTALKQFLSMPAYLSDSNPVYLAANIANPIGAWKWSMENLPLFEKRWKSRMAGDPRLMKSEMDWKMWRSHVVEIASRIGMSPNAFVDALTVAIGSHAMYQTKKQKYLRYGYDEEVAEKRAKQDATILFNQTQQSSESAFLSTMQVDRSWLSVLFTIFRNSSMSYTRQLYDAIRNIKHRFEPGYQSMSEEYMAKQMRRDGIDPDKADSNAKSEYRRSLLRDIARIGVFGYILQFAWNFGAYLPYLIAGDDKDEKSKMWDDVINHTMFGSIEGLTGGDVMSSAGQMALNGEAANWSYLVKDMPLASDLAAILQKMPKDKVAAMNDVVNLLVQSGVGVNPQSLTDAVVAIMDYCGDDAETSRECALLIARIINCPQSQTDKIYFDELGATAAEASNMTPAEIAERYAEYKIHRGAPLTGWAYSEEARDSVKTAQQNRVLTKAKEKMSNRMETEATKQLLSTYDEVSKLQTELSKLKKTDRAAYREGMKQLRQKYNMREHGRMKRYKHDMKQLTEKYLRSKNAEERDSLVRVMTTTRDKLLDDIGRMNQQ